MVTPPPQSPEPNPRPGRPVPLASEFRRIIIPLALMLLALAALLVVPHPANAQANGGAILIWPVGPVIETDDRAAALWLENPGKAPVTLQVRIYVWAQADGKNVYAAQDAIIGTPPIVTIAPGEKQLVRLTRTLPTPNATEAAYRVVVDEIPAPRPTGEAGAAVSFRMRYSIPLFAYGGGLASPEAQKKRKPAPDRAVAAPALDWRIAETSEGRFLEIRNRGPIHARLTEVDYGASGTETVETGPTKGLFGYVLAGQTMRWPLATSRVTAVAAAVNGAPAAPIGRRAD